MYDLRRQQKALENDIRKRFAEKTDGKNIYFVDPEMSYDDAVEEIGTSIPEIVFQAKYGPKEALVHSIVTENSTVVRTVSDIGEEILEHFPEELSSDSLLCILEAIDKQDPDPDCNSKSAYLSRMVRRQDKELLETIGKKAEERDYLFYKGETETQEGIDKMLDGGYLPHVVEHNGDEYGIYRTEGGEFHTHSVYWDGPTNVCVGNIETSSLLVLLRRMEAQDEIDAQK